MSKRKLIWIIVAWVILTLFNYYGVCFFLLGFEWMLLVLILFVIWLIQLIKLIKERKNLRSLRVQYFIVFLVLFLLTFYRFIPNRIIENVDWMVLYNKRMEIVHQVIEKKLDANVKWSSGICELPFEFPIVSNGGNDIGITRNEKTKTTTVTFWVFRNFFDAPSTHFIYTDDPEQIRELEQEIQNYPEQNWKLEDNWYRAYGCGMW